MDFRGFRSKNIERKLYKFHHNDEKGQTERNLTAAPRLAEILMIYRVSGSTLPDSNSS